MSIEKYSQNGFAGLLILLIAGVTLTGFAYYHLTTTSVKPPLDTSSPTPTLIAEEHTIDFEKLEQEMFDAPQYISVYPTSEVRAKFAGWDNEGHYVRQIQYFNPGPTQPSAQELYSFFEQQLIDPSWNLTNNTGIFCDEQSNTTCPELILLEAQNEDVTVTIEAVNTAISYTLLWYDNEAEKIQLSLAPDTDSSIMPDTFNIDTVYVNIDDTNVTYVYEMNSKNTFDVHNSQSTFVKNGYSECSLGSTHFSFSFNCGKEQPNEYFVTETDIKSLNYYKATITHSISN